MNLDAIAQFVIFSALALHDHPDYRQTLQQGDDKDVERFVQEVRRVYPFFPLTADDPQGDPPLRTAPHKPQNSRA